MEDTLNSNGYQCEHGLSLYIETEHHHILADTGASALTWENAEHAGIDLSCIDTVVLSHGHYDHTGGVMSFVQKNKRAKIYVRTNADGCFYHRKPEGDKYIGIDPAIIKLKQLIPVAGAMTIDEELSLFTNITGRRRWPSGNRTLCKRIGSTFLQDPFDHEQCLVIREKDTYTLISGCAHNGILNILDRFRELYHCDPDTVISGFHMQKQAYTDEDIDTIRKTAEELSRMHTIFYTGHCTGDTAYAYMKEIMQEQLHHITELI